MPVVVVAGMQGKGSGVVGTMRRTGVKRGGRDGRERAAMIL